MRIMIASDIHGSAYYMKKLEERYREEKPDKVLLLGDLLYHGPRNDLPKGYEPKEVIKILNTMKKDLLCVRGNCDTEVDQMVLEFPIMADYAIIYDEKHTIYATHGHVYNPENPPKLSQGDILLCGHTHVPAVYEFDGKFYVNPGSVSIPKEGSEHSYIMLENGDFRWKNLEGKELKYVTSQKFNI